jgi:hypothetical protein
LYVYQFSCSCRPINVFYRLVLRSTLQAQAHYVVMKDRSMIILKLPGEEMVIQLDWYRCLICKVNFPKNISKLNNSYCPLFVLFFLYPFQRMFKCPYVILSSQQRRMFYIGKQSAAFSNKKWHNLMSYIKQLTPTVIWWHYTLHAEESFGWSDFFFD